MGCRDYARENIVYGLMISHVFSLGIREMQSIEGASACFQLARTEQDMEYLDTYTQICT